MTIPWLSLTAQAQDHSPHSEPSTDNDLFNKFSVVFLYAHHTEIGDCNEWLPNTWRNRYECLSERHLDRATKSVIAHPSIETGNTEENRLTSHHLDSVANSCEELCSLGRSFRRDTLFELFVAFILCLCHLCALNK